MTGCDVALGDCPNEAPDLDDSNSIPHLVTSQSCYLQSLGQASSHSTGGYSAGGSGTSASRAAVQEPCLKRYAVRWAVAHLCMASDLPRLESLILNVGFWHKVFLAGNKRVDPEI